MEYASISEAEDPKMLNGLQLKAGGSNFNYSLQLALKCRLTILPWLAKLKCMLYLHFLWMLGIKREGLTLHSPGDFQMEGGSIKIGLIPFLPMI
jgi:hypothetical protein